MFSQWRMTREFRPCWEIIKVEIAEITYNNNSYHIKLPIKVRYTSRDPRYSIYMDCTSILLDMQNLGKGRDKKPYRLNSVVELATFNLPKMGTVEKNYIFSREEDGKPLLPNHTLCKIIAIGKARIRGITNVVTLQPKQFEVIVHKSPGVI